MKNTTKAVAESKALSPYQQLKETVLDLELKNNVQQETIFDLERNLENTGFLFSQSEGNVKLAMSAVQNLGDRIGFMEQQLNAKDAKIKSLVETVSASLKHAAIDAYEAEAQKIRTKERHAALLGIVNGL